MRPRFTRFGLSAGLALTLAAAAAVTVGGPAPATASDEPFGPGVEVETRDGGAVGFIGTEPGQPLGRAAGITASSTAESAASAFVNQNADAFRIARGTTLSAARSNVQATGNTTVRLQQTVDGIEVLGAEYAVQVDDDNRVVSAVGESVADDIEVARPTVPASEAVKSARAWLAAEEGVDVSEVKGTANGLKIFDPRIVGGDAIPVAHTVHDIEVSVGLHARQRVFIEVTTGAFIAAFNEVHSALNRRVCDFANQRRADHTCYSPTLVEGGSTAGKSADVVRAYEYAGTTYNFLKREFNRDSLNGKGMPLLSTVRYCPPVGEGECPYDNAFWDGRQMVYGAGFANADDVVGHELVHGLTHHTSRLFYYAQSGAINESISDVFGEFIDWENGDGASNRWLLGEDSPLGAIRDMRDPNRGNQPARMRDPMYYKGLGDNMGVHVNSGVGNKTASLATDGGSFNGQTVTGLGMRRVAAIWYETNTGLLTSASDYQDLGRGLRQACRNLTGKTLRGGSEKITKANCTELGKAIKATELDKPRANAKDAKICAPAKKKAKYTFRENFEKKNKKLRKRWKAQKPWFVPGNANPLRFDATYATSGKKNLWGWDRPGNAYPNSNRGKARAFWVKTKKKVKVPKKKGRLTFKHAYMFDVWSNGKNASGGRVEYSLNGKKWRDVYKGKYPNKVHLRGSAFSKKRAFAGHSGGYRTESVAFPKKARGKKVFLRFRIGSDANVAGNSYGWFIDDVGVYRCR